MSRLVMKMKRQLYLPVLIALLAALVSGAIPLSQGIAYASPGWVSPTGFVDSGAVWADEPLAYDENTATFAYVDCPAGWCDYLELTHAALNCDKVQLWVGIVNTQITTIEVDVYYSDAWHNIYSGAIVTGSFQEYVIGSTESVASMRIRFYSTKVNRQADIYEADFNGELPPAPSLIIIDTLGKTTMVRLSSDGTLLQSCVVADPADNVILELDSGTKIICSDNEVPERLEVSLPGEPPPMPEGFAAVSPVYDLTAYISGGVPRPVTFDPPARLQINYGPEAVPENTSSIFIAYHDEEEGWTQLESPTGFVAAAGEAAAQVSHFTPFVVMADLAAPPLPARFEVRNLDINPIQVTAGKDITISAQLVNIGGLRGEYTLIVNIEGLLETSQVIRLAPGQSQIITFTVTPGSSGSYQVEIGDLRGNFVAVPISPPEVTEPEPGKPGAVSYGWLIAVIAAVAALAVLVFIMATKRLQHALGMERGWFEKPAKPFTTAGRRLRRAPLVEKPAEPVPSALRVGNLKITPNQVKPGETITVFAEATNTSLVTSSYSLVLKIKGIVEAVKEITLSPGQSQKVAFTIIKTKPGVYDVDLEDLKGSFTVEG